MDNELESMFIHTHGALRTFSPNSEFMKVGKKQFLAAYNISIAERPVQLQNKTGIIERKGRSIELVLESLQHGKSVSRDVVLLFPAMFLSNMVCSSNLRSAFELLRGYKAALFGSGTSLVSPKLLEAYKDQQYVRELRRLLKS